MLGKTPTTTVEKPVDKKWTEKGASVGLQTSREGTKPICIGRETFRQSQGRERGWPRGMRMLVRQRHGSCRSPAVEPLRVGGGMNSRTQRTTAVHAEGRPFG